MNCFPCFQNKQESSSEEEKNDLPIAQPKDFTPPGNNDNGGQDPDDAPETEENTVKSFTFRELATATKHFRQECLLGEGGFGKVFKGTLQATGQIVAVRQLDRNGTQASKDFVFEVSSLSFLQHPNLVKMVGYCADGEQRLLVYEYLPSGSLENHLFDLPAGKAALDWNTRMKIALGIASGLEYLHEKADPPVIYRDLKSSNVLLNEAKVPKLSDYGLAKLVQKHSRMHVSVMTGFNGYCAPEYERNGELTLKSDVYSFGVVLLELITGRRALDNSRPPEEQSLVSWAQPIFRDPSKFPDMADPLLRKGFPVTSLNQAVGVAAMCLQEEPSARPLISDISAALSFLAMAPPEAPIPDRLVPILSRVSTSRRVANNNSGNKQDDTSDSEDEDQEQDPNEQEEDGNSSSDYEYGESSEGSDYEETSRMASQNERNADKSRCKSTKSKKLGSSSKRKSKKTSVKISRGSSSRSGQSSSSGSQDGFSLRCDSSNPEASVPSNSRPDNNHQSDDSDNSSGSDEEHWNRSDGSSSQNRSHATRSESNKDNYGSFNSRSDDDNK